MVRLVEYDYDEVENGHDGLAAPCPDCGTRVFISGLMSYGCYSCDLDSVAIVLHPEGDE